MRSTTALPAALLAFASLAAPEASAQSPPDLAGYFGFEEPRILVVDDECGPMAAADFNADGRQDLAVVNNRKSRIDLFLQRSSPRSDAAMRRDRRVNQLPPPRWYDRVEISVARRVEAILPHDVDADGRLDLLYAGRPGEIVALRQVDADTFEQGARTRVRGLAATRSAFRIADVSGDDRPELLAAVDGDIHVFPLQQDGALGEPTPLGSREERIVAFFVEDFDGDGRADVLGVIPESEAPLRLWRQFVDPSDPSRAEGVLGPELRFESPTLREVDPVRFPDRAAASIAVIEQASRRLVLYDLAQEAIEPAASARVRDVQAEVFGLAGGAQRDRSVAIADLDLDGRDDLIATDAAGNRLVARFQRPGLGLVDERYFSAFKSPKTVAAGQWDDDEAPELFVLSEEEKAVGVADFDPRRGTLSFPQPIPLATGGGEPVAMGAVELAEGPAVAVVVRERRDHVLELHRPNAEPVVIELEDVRRPPQSILAADLDDDDADDLLLFTPGEPMVMVRTAGERMPSTVLTDETMGQFGLVEAAGPANTGLLDVDGDGSPELLIADSNFIRACDFEPGFGWRVVEQVTATDPSTTFESLALLRRDASPYAGDAITAGDAANNRIVVVAAARGDWGVVDTLRLDGFNVEALLAGRFNGDRTPSLLALGDAAVGVIPLQGRRAALEPVDAWRSEEEDRLEHEIGVGDVNADGYVDLAVLDAGEQMCSILTLSASRRLLFATEFKVFESRLFTGGDQREFEPSEVLITDLTGDGAQDLILLTHDRILVHPQMTRPE